MSRQLTESKESLTLKCYCDLKLTPILLFMPTGSAINWGTISDFNARPLQNSNNYGREQQRNLGREGKWCHPIKPEI